MIVTICIQWHGWSGDTPRLFSIRERSFRSINHHQRTLLWAIPVENQAPRRSHYNFIERQAPFKRESDDLKFGINDSCFYGLKKLNLVQQGTYRNMHRNAPQYCVKRLQSLSSPIVADGTSGQYLTRSMSNIRPSARR